eukprot:m.164007 g.164007  ORF g.164007 m.164007 type:complete len:64 (+) comp16397_c4_seq2:4960-5151(+)
MQAFLLPNRWVSMRYLLNTRILVHLYDVVSRSAANAGVCPLNSNLGTEDFKALAYVWWYFLAT